MNLRCLFKFKFERLFFCKTNFYHKGVSLIVLGAALTCASSAVMAQAPQDPNPVNEAKTVATVNKTTAAPLPTPTKTVDGGEVSEREKDLLNRIELLEKRLTLLETASPSTAAIDPNAAVAGQSKTNENAAENAQSVDQTATTAAMIKTSGGTVKTGSTPAQITEDDRGVLDFFRDTTLNFNIDGYYGYNFNRPYNRVNLLRAYDVTSNSFSLNQANVVIENAPNVEQNRRFGFRLDLQYGQATETTQGNPNNELRPQTFRPIWQAYGTYVAPVGKGLTVDFGKFASSLGYESNYTKDNYNYSRSYFFNYLPYYHFGVRATYPVTKKLTATYWLVNGTQQSEDFNESKSQAILLNYKPTDKVVLQGNYYVGREQRDQNFVINPNPNGMGSAFERLVPRGKFHVLDAYGTFLLTDKLTFALEGDYVVNRFNSTDRPSRVTGGAAYLRYQFTPKFALAGRTEYLSDRGGLFSGTTQALKEATFTSEYKFAEGFLVRGEYRRDWSNQPYFFTNSLTDLKKEQNTATLGFVWWFGRKQGAW